MPSRSCRPRALRWSSSRRTAAETPHTNQRYTRKRQIMSQRLQGKVVIVTGAGCVGPGWGNGRAVAVRFAEEGAKVFAVDKSAHAMEETLARVRAVQGEVEPYTCDMTSAAEVEAM